MRSLFFNLGHPTSLQDAYPFTQKTMDTLGETKLVSPRVGRDWFAELGIELPSSDVADQDHTELEKIRMDVSNNVWPKWLFEKYKIGATLAPMLTKYGHRLLTPAQAIAPNRILTERDPELCALAVRFDQPCDAWDKIIEPYLADEKVKLRADLVKHSGVQFVERAMARMTAHVMITKALDAAFDLKYVYGTARPIEYNPAGASIEQYPCPAHPELVSGHAAFFGATYNAARTLFQLSPEQDIAIKDALLQLSFFRIFAGVHISSSSITGFELGIRHSELTYKQLQG